MHELSVGERNARPSPSWAAQPPSSLGRVATSVSVAQQLACIPGAVSCLCDMLETPLKVGSYFRYAAEKERDVRAQYEAMALVQVSLSISISLS